MPRATAPPTATVAARRLRAEEVRMSRLALLGRGRIAARWAGHRGRSADAARRRGRSHAARSTLAAPRIAAAGSRDACALGETLGQPLGSCGQVGRRLGRHPRWRAHTGWADEGMRHNLARSHSESTYDGATVYFTSFHMAQSRAPTSTYGDLAKQQKCFRCLAPSHLSPTALVALCTHINALGHKPLIITCRHPRAACADAASSSWLPCRRSRSTAS